ncbi:MAG: SagB/ThcOx family dehydrogenase, partial [Candidatus Hodarchaeales archaeon]
MKISNNRFYYLVAITFIVIISVTLFFSLLSFYNQNLNVTDTFSLPSVEYGQKTMSNALLSSWPWNQTFIDNPSPLSLQDVGNLLWAGQGENRPGFKVVPSAGATYPMDLYLFSLNGVEGMSGRISHYLPSGHRLEKKVDVLSNETLTSQLPEGIYESNALMWIIVTSTEERTSPRYGSRTPRYIQLELGHLLENLRLEAWSREVSLHTWLQPVNSPNWSQWLPNNAIVESIIAIGRPDLKPEISNPQMKLIKGEFHPILNKINYQSSYSVERAIYLRTSKREYTNRLLYKAEVS